MKYETLLTLFSLCVGITLAMVPAPAPEPVPEPAPKSVPAAPVAPVTSAPAATLTQDIDEILNLIPQKPLWKLIVRYLLNDEQFQAVIRTINSQDAFFVRMRFNNLPEVIAFKSWMRSQLSLSGGSLESDDSHELNIFNPIPYWANTVNGWQGFINEFQLYYPQELIQGHINMKVQQGGIFAQFWTRLQGLKRNYETMLLWPETQRIVTQLQAIGVDTNQLDQLIRALFGWFQAPATGAGAGVPAGSAAAV